MAHIVFTFLFLIILFSQNVSAMAPQKQQARPQTECQVLLKACTDSYHKATAGPKDADKYNTCDTECKKHMQTRNCAEDDRKTASTFSLKCRTEAKNIKSSSKK